MKANTKVYTCICGKEFTNSQAINGHKCHCKKYLTTVNKYDSYLLMRKLSLAKTHKTQKNNNKIKKDFYNKQWKNEQHHCEHCGKLMLEKYGSGRFCSRSCANSHIQINLYTKQKQTHRHRKQIMVDKGERE